MKNGTPIGDALPLVRKTVQAKRVRVGDYWETGDGTALVVTKVEADDISMLAFEIGSRVGQRLRTWARPSERVQIRRLKPAGKQP